MKKGNKILKVIGIVFLALILALVILNFMLGSIVLKQANKQLPNNLNATASIGDLDIRLVRGFVALKDLKIGQPEGFGEGPLVEAGRAEVKLDLGSLNSGLITIDHIILDDATINLVKNKEGIMNVEALPKAPAEPAPEKPATEPEPLLLKHVELNGVDFSFTDHNVGKKGLIVALTNINVSLDNLLVDPEAADTQENAARISLSAFLKQPDFPSARIGVTASLGPIISTNIPSINAAARITGLELKPWGVLFPGVGEVLGGSALDLAVNAGVRQDLLDCKAMATMASGQKHKAIIGGTPLKPEFDKDQALGMAFGRVTGVFGNTAGNIANTGVEAAEAVAGTATKAVKDAGKTVSGLGKGLLKTVKSAATLDVKGATSNLTETAVGAANDAAGTVTGAATNLTTGVTQAAGNVTGVSNTQAFRGEVSKRADEQQAEAASWVSEQVFPPKRQFSEK